MIIGKKKHGGPILTNSRDFIALWYKNKCVGGCRAEHIG